jgi:hypothetical protein
MVVDENVIPVAAIEVSNAESCDTIVTSSPVNRIVTLAVDRVITFAARQCITSGAAENTIST